MYLELHMIQNFAPSCLNRDDLNAPKECEFGGVRRARVSSQCLKRSIRMSPAFEKGVQGAVGTRTRLLADRLRTDFLAKGKPAASAAAVAKLVADAIGSGSKEDGRTNVGLYLGYDEIGRLVAGALERWDELAADPEESEAEESRKKGAKKGAKKSKNSAQELATTFQKQFIPETKAADIALFGRMVAEATHFNVDAACQVAHAISTHRVAPEMDFFTAVDDLQPKGEVGAGMMGTQEFNSPCLYRYANIHLRQLAKNLGDDAELARAAALAFLRASVEAIPAAKQNSHAAQNPPDFVLAVVRTTGQPMSLANAFVKPVRVKKDDEGIVENSVGALAGYWNKLHAVFGGSFATAHYFSLCNARHDIAGADDVKTLAALLAAIRAALEKGGAA